MFAARYEISKPAFLAAALGFLVSAGLAIAQSPGRPQASTDSDEPPPSAPPPTMELNITSVPPVGSDGRIYVDEDCAILPDLNHALNRNQKVEPKYDPVICHIEGAANSEHREEKAIGAELDRSRVDVREQEFVLENITMKPVIFYVVVRVPKPWVVDSDPQPKEMHGDIAIFEVHATAGETVQLHVGVRHTKDLKPKPLRSPPSP